MGSAMLQTPAIDIEAHILIEISSDRAIKVWLCRLNYPQPDGRVSDHWAVLLRSGRLCCPQGAAVSGTTILS